MRCNGSKIGQKIIRSPALSARNRRSVTRLGLNISPPWRCNPYQGAVHLRICLFELQGHRSHFHLRLKVDPTQTWNLDIWMSGWWLNHPTQHYLFLTLKVEISWDHPREGLEKIETCWNRLKPSPEWRSPEALKSSPICIPPELQDLYLTQLISNPSRTHGESPAAIIFGDLKILPWREIARPWSCRCCSLLVGGLNPSEKY